MKIKEINVLLNRKFIDEKLTDIYVDKSKIPYEKERYVKAINKYQTYFDGDEIELFSAPGRSEIGGNHTDHQHGEVLAASINKDAIAVARKLDEPFVKVLSDGYNDLITISLNELEKKMEEEGTTHALIRGVLAKMRMNGHKIGGFQAYVTSDVLIGAGLSSSAAFETLIGTMISYMYNDGKISAVEIAKIGQYAENEYFGKPCGLMDQMACSVGSLVYIDFADPENPMVEQVNFDMDAYGYSLCITDTKGSHADLTPDYAAIPKEMKQAAECFGKKVLGEVSKKEIINNITLIRERAGDRAALRALHFICENERVQKEVDALRKDNFPQFLANVKESGDSSFKYLQNVYTCDDVQHQNVSVALALSDVILGEKGVCRVHGGGFAGTIQAFVPIYLESNYQKEMDKIFGKGSCEVLKIRKYGGIKVL
nr:galactokinase family protein [uncultured Blautia sp.]